MRSAFLWIMTVLLVRFYLSEIDVLCFYLWLFMSACKIFMYIAPMSHWLKMELNSTEPFFLVEFTTYFAKRTVFYPYEPMFGPPASLSVGGI